MRRIIPCHALSLSIAVLVLQMPALAGSVPFWGAKTSVPIDTPIDELKKGQFLWMGDAVTWGPVVIVVSLTEQRAYVYRNGVLIGATTVSIVLSQGSQRVVVYRNGIEIGRARMTISGDEPITSHALVLTEGPSNISDPYVPDPTNYRWVRIGVPGHMQEAGTEVTAAALARIKLPAEFVQQVNSILTPGATVFVTSEALSPQSSGPILRVVDADPPAGTKRS
jgi:hypothetical protein